MAGSSSLSTSPPRPVLSRRRNGSGSNHDTRSAPATSANPYRGGNSRYTESKKDSRRSPTMVAPRMTNKTGGTRRNSSNSRGRPSPMGLAGTRCMLYVAALVSVALIVMLSNKIGYESPAMTKFATGAIDVTRRVSLEGAAAAKKTADFLTSLWNKPLFSEEQENPDIAAKRLSFFTRTTANASSMEAPVDLNDGSTDESPRQAAEQVHVELDARIAGYKEESKEKQEPIVVSDSSVSTAPKGLLIDRLDFGKTPTQPGETENVLVVIISNRRDGIIPTIASILITSTLPVDVVLIGVHEINQQVGDHFGARINQFVSLSVDDITEDLLAQDFTPIWKWPEWHSSVDNPDWRNENTIHIGPWDNLNTHAHVLNHLRFYLAHVSIFRQKRYFYFLDDDIMVQKDLGVLAEKTMNDLEPSRGLVCPCNIWMWNSECFHFEFQSKKDYILSMPSLYGDREVCKSDSEDHCVPANYWDFVHKNLPPGGKDQHAWNFGFSLFALNNWRDLNLTGLYEGVMKESYRLHVFPETSLTFGLGVSYIAFGGAVECWNEDYVQVRDGFGFIEWDRYQKTFGEDFYKSVDVVHYTGPDKPWVNESRIEERAITPWLKIMEHEKMPIPTQLPLEPTKNLFLLLASDRAGAQWIMSMLDGHPQVCASGEADKPETGFPADVLLPDGLPWYPYCSIKRGCSYEFVRTSVAELTANTTKGELPMRCQSSYDKVSDPLSQHLSRLCRFVERLDGNFENKAIAKLWLDAFVEENRDFLGCGCVRGVKAKGLKVLMEWMLPKKYPFDNSIPPFVDLTESRAHGSKMIRLRRRNIWAKYKSKLLAKETDIFHPTTSAQKQAQLDTTNDITIEAHHMEWNMMQMEAIEKAADEWANNHASEVLWIDYEDCRADTPKCFTDIFNFIGVDSSIVTGKKAQSFKSIFASFSENEHTLEHIANKGQTLELLGINGWDGHSQNEKYIPIHHLSYESNELLVDSRRHLGIRSMLFGQSEDSNVHWMNAAVPVLEGLDSDTLVVLSSDRDSRINFPVGDHERITAVLSSFRSRYQKLTAKSPGSIVVSTSRKCCATAMSMHPPGSFFDENGERSRRACSFGASGCEWQGKSSTTEWVDFMHKLAESREANSDHAYFDASLVAGTAADLLSFIKKLDIQNGEDSVAVVTDFAYRFPHLVVGDYEETIFGERRPPLAEDDDSCVLRAGVDTESSRVISDAVFEYRPGSLGCGDEEKIVAPKYPVWDKAGIELPPILDLVDAVADLKESVVLPPYYGRTPDYRQGPEVPYIMDSDGLSASKLVRERTNNETAFWRMIPTERFMKKSLQLLIDDEEDSDRWVQLKAAIKAGGFPFFAWYGDYKSCNHRNRDSESIPLFTTCATAACTHSFPMPNYMTIIDTQMTEDNWRGVFKEFKKDYPWEQKERKVVWRGALSEAEWRNAFSSVRWRVAEHVHNSQSGLFDIGLTGIPDWVTEHVTFDLSKIGGFKKGIAPMKNFQKYTAILDMDGNSWSSRFGTLLCYNSVVLKVEAKYFDYFYSDLKPWTHYVPVANDLSDFEQNAAWVLDPKNDEAVKAIINAANQWCSQRLVPAELEVDFLDIMESYIRFLHAGDSNWQTDFLQWKSNKELQNRPKKQRGKIRKVAIPDKYCEAWVIECKAIRLLPSTTTHTEKRWLPMNLMYESNALPIEVENTLHITAAMKLKRRRSIRNLVQKGRKQPIDKWLRKKRVSFQTDEHGDVQCHDCQIPHQRVLSEAEKANCWWSEDESASARLEAMVLQDEFSNDTEYMVSCRELLLHCTASNEPSVTNVEDVLETIVPSEARGLEFQTMRLLQHRQSRSIRTVLVSQERLRWVVDWKQREHMIALQYRRISMYASEWARLLAAGDEWFCPNKLS